jgi:predicted DNA binding CopG/RHH family protein
MTRSKKTTPLDEEEKDLEKALETVNVKSLSRPGKKVQKKFASAAKNFIKMETKMNIRIDPVQLDAIKKRAKREGLKYQSLVKSVLHKYITGQLIERKTGMA